MRKNIESCVNCGTERISNFGPISWAGKCDLRDGLPVPGGLGPCGDLHRWEAILPAVRGIIFTRHALLPEQRREIDDLQKLHGFREIIDMTGDAAHVLRTRGDAERILEKWLQIGGDAEELHIFGVFPPIIRACLLARHRPGGTRAIVLQEAHNINRAEEGKPPQFEHAGWVVTGMYTI